MYIPSIWNYKSNWWQTLSVTLWYLCQGYWCPLLKTEDRTEGGPMDAMKADCFCLCPVKPECHQFYLATVHFRQNQTQEEGNNKGRIWTSTKISMQCQELSVSRLHVLDTILWGRQQELYFPFIQTDIAWFFKVLSLYILVILYVWFL